MTVGEKIKALRKSIGLTQTELGQKVGVQKNAVSKWECGRVEDIPTSTIKQLANLFNVPASYLIDDDASELHLEVNGMSIRNDRIRALVESSNISYVDLEKITGIKKSSLQRYASGATTKIPLDVIEKLSSAFNVSQAYLIGWEEEEIEARAPVLTDGEKALLDIFRRIPDDRKQLVLQMIRAAAETQP